jgi:CheY-like chemotaxis protein
MKMETINVMGKYYHRIPGLLVPKSTDYDYIHGCINKFIDLIPGLTEYLENNLDVITSPLVLADLTSKLTGIQLMLKDVYARSLETETSMILRSLKFDETVPLAKRSLKKFIPNLITLSVEMQKAQNTGNEVDLASIPQSKAESLADMANNLYTVSNLIRSGDYDLAQSMINELESKHPDVNITKLLDLVMAEKYKEAETFADTMKNNSVKAINDLAGTDFSKKILAVDDMAEILSFVNNALKTHYKVFGVTNGKTALKLLNTHEPDLFIFDIDMPEMDGFELAETIRGMEKYAHTPLIFLTGNSSRERILRAMKLGCNDFIVKPSTHEYLMTKVSKHLTNEG